MALSNQASRRRRGSERRQALVDFMGGACHRCGFAGHPCQLHFHHAAADKIYWRPLTGSDRYDSRFSTEYLGRHAMTDDLLEELAGTELLCACCHALETAGLANG
jgi:hypothetical protein